MAWITSIGSILKAIYGLIQLFRVISKEVRENKEKDDLEKSEDRFRDRNKNDEKTNNT